MDTKQNNYAINEFKGGMNSDLSYDVLLPNQYVFGENIRITTNALISEINNSNAKEGALCPIPEGVKINTAVNKTVKDILAADSIGNVGVIITRNLDDRWSVYRVEKADDSINYHEVFTSTREVSHENKFSIVLNKEINNEIMLYIATGESQIMSINISDDEYNSNITDENLFVSEYHFPQRKIYIADVINGSLKTGQVLYTYRFYKKRGIKSKLAPLTNKFQIIDSQKSIENGNAEDTKTGMGLRLLLTIDDNFAKTFDKIQVYRIYYNKSSVNSDIELIYDDYIDGRDMLYLNDTGISALEIYSIEEFSTLDGLQLIPLQIELNQNYLFAANVLDITKLKINETSFDARSYSMNSLHLIVLHNQDDIKYEGQPHIYYETLINDIPENESLNEYSDVNLNIDDKDYCRFDDQLYYGGVGKNVSWRFITTPILLHTDDLINKKLPPKDLDSGVQKLYYLKHNTSTNEIELEESDQTTRSVFEQNNVNYDTILSYENPITSSLFRSLKRDEVYRYGIVLYDNNGRRSDVQWIADIRTPNIKKFPSSEYNGTNSSANITNGVYQLGGYINAVSNVSDNSTEAGVNKLILEQINNKDLNSGFVNLFINTRIIYATEVMKSDPIHFKQGQKVSVNILDGSEIFFFGTQYRWYHNGQPRGIYSIPVQHFDTEAIAQHELHTITDIDQNGGRISNIEIAVRGKLILDNGVEISPYSGETYEILQDCNGLIEHYCVISYDRNEGFYSEYLMATGPHSMYGAIGSYTINYQILTSEQEDQPVDVTTPLSGLIAYPLGIQFNVHNLPQNIAAYQIVRCEKPTIYTKNIIQCVASRPIRQKINVKNNRIVTYSPYYPHHVLNAQPYSIGTGKQSYNVKTTFRNTEIPNTDAVTDMGSQEERNIFLLYSPEITILRNTTLQKINKTCSVDFMAYCYAQQAPMINSEIYLDSFILYTRQSLNNWTDSTDPNKYDKSSFDFMYSYYNIGLMRNNGNNCKFDINGIADVMNPNWESGFSNVQIGTGKIDGKDTAGVITFATKNYKSYICTINDKEYLNWHCNGMYNLKAYSEDSNYGQLEPKACMLVEDIDGNTRKTSATGLIGPGPVCYVVSVDDKVNSPIYELLPIYTKNQDGNDVRIAVSAAYICNITHKANQFAGYTKEERKYDTYYGFGNFMRKTSNNSVYNVFDGDTYITPFEIVLMYKAFDFNDKDTLLSGQFVYYVPIESSINNYFNYGYNYRNTKSKNLQIVPGEITGIAVQSRPSNQYNLIYSDNNVSNDVYNADDKEDDIDNISQRIYYSQQKISGENIDKYTYFKPLDYIDVDTRYGEITSILSNKDVLYCWLDTAFGRIHVNERSLISDQNNNTIQLGTGGVMQRIDYIDLHYGMSKYQHAAVGVEDKVYWIDDKNKSVLVSDGQRAANLSEQLNVQNIVNERFGQSCPEIHYDLQNQELLCKCLNNDLIIFNTKLNVATSLYTRRYLDILNLNNTIYGIDNKLNLILYNNIAYRDDTKFMLSTVKFVANKTASTTKVFDNQEIVFDGQYLNSTDMKQFMDNKEFKFSTNIDQSVYTKVDYTTREGNIEYAVPRVDDALYGNRHRGKWMCVEIKDKSNNTNFAISHIITKFRQSFS